MAKLTKRVVDQIVPGDAEAMHWDDGLKGFGLRVWPSGRKVYVVMSRVKGRLRRITIGPHGPITPEQARIRAHEIISEAKAGRDPAKELDQARKAPTMKGLGERFLKEHVAVRCKPSTPGRIQAIRRAVHQSEARHPQGHRHRAPRYRRTAPGSASHSLSGQPNPRRALQDVQPRRNLGPAPGREQSLHARQEICRGETRAIP